MTPGQAPSTALAGDVTKQELAQKVALDAGLNGRDCKEAVDATFEVIAAGLAAAGGVAIRGFGKFGVSSRPAREGRNPATGETIQIAASKARGSQLAQR